MRFVETLKCEGCNVIFKYNTQLDIHMKRVHKESEYVRLQRIQKMATEALIAHKKANEHSEPEANNKQAEPQLKPKPAVGSELVKDMSYNCEKCPNKMNRIDELETHMKEKHGGEPITEEKGFVVSSFSGGKTFKITKKRNSQLEKKFEDAFVTTSLMIKKANHGPEMFISDNISIKIVDLPPQQQESGVNAMIMVKHKETSGLVNAIFYKTKTLKMTKKKGEDPDLVDILADLIMKPQIESLMAGKPSTFSTKKPQEQNINIKVDETEMVKCDLCDKTFNSQHGADVHRGKAHTEMKGIFKCTECKVTTKTKKAIDTHMIKMHITQAHPTGRIPGTNICDICANDFKDQTDLKKHEQVCHKRSIAFHDKVGVHTPVPMAAQKREYEEGTTDESDEDGEDMEKLSQFKCELCKKTFIDSNSAIALGRLLEHKKTFHTNHTTHTKMQ